MIGEVLRRFWVSARGSANGSARAILWVVLGHLESDRFLGVPRGSISAESKWFTLVGISGEVRLTAEKHSCRLLPQAKRE